MSIEYIFCDAADSAFVRVVPLVDSDLRLEPKLVHEPVDQLVVDLPPLPPQLGMNPPVTETMVHTLENITDSLLELGIFIDNCQTLLMIEKR